MKRDNKQNGSIKNIPVFQKSKKRVGAVSWYIIIIPFHYIPTPSISGFSNVALIDAELTLTVSWLQTHYN